MTRTSASRRTLTLALIGAALLALAAMALRYGVIENQLLPRDCGPGGGDPAWSCGMAWAVVESFRFQRLGWAALICGALAFACGWRVCAWVGWFLGVVGLVLYSPDYAAPGGLLALLALLRFYLPPRQRRQGEGESDDQPA